MTTQEKYDLINKCLELNAKRDSSDSVTEKSELWKELGKLNLGRLNGTLVKTNSGKFGRLWVKYSTCLDIYFGGRELYDWTGNSARVSSLCFEIVDENDDELIEQIREIDSEITDLENKIWDLKSKKNKLTKDFVVCVNPESFEETKEINRSAFSLNGNPVYIKEAFCEITGIRVTS